MALSPTKTIIAATSILAVLGGCGDRLTDYIAKYGEAGSVPKSDQWGRSVEQNANIQNGTETYAMSLAERFHREVPDTVNFAFNSSLLDDQARAILAQQANFIRQFPEVRFRVYGYTDLVGTNAYNKRLGMRRAQAVVAYMATRGISRSRLEAVVSYGETRPMIDTPGRERRNRRAITEVSGFVADAPLILNGKYAEVIAREYVKSATEIPPKAQKSTIATGSSGGGGG